LQALYGDEASLELLPSPQGTLAKLCLPFRQAQKAA